MDIIEVLNDEISGFMITNNIRVTSPEECIGYLREQGMYNTVREDALPLRNDLRQIRDTFGLPYETNDLIIMQANNNRWYIVLKWEA